MSIPLRFRSPPFPALLAFIFVRRQPYCKFHASPFEKRRLRETLRPDRLGIFCSDEAEERSNTDVLQVMRQVRTGNYNLSGVTRSSLANLSKHEQSEPALKGIISVLFGLSSLISDSFISSSAPKIPQNSAPLGSKNFKGEDFWLSEAQNAANTFVFASILTMQRRKSSL